MIDILRFLHSWSRWIFLVVAVIAVVYFVIGLAQQQPWRKQAQSLLTAFSSLMGVQWLLGLGLLLALGSATGFGVRHYWEHLFAQTLGFGLAHLHFRWRRREMADARRWRNGLLLLVGVLVLVFVGILALPSAIQWRFATG